MIKKNILSSKPRKVLQRSKDSTSWARALQAKQEFYKRNKGARERPWEPKRESVRARENQDVGGSQREPDETKGSQREPEREPEREL